MLERELKLAPPARFALPELSGVAGVTSVDALPPLELRSVYFDTEDLRLARFGATLRWRSGEEPGALWTVKLPDSAEGSVAHRAEHQFVAAPGAMEVPAAAIDLVLALTRGAPLQRSAELRTRRARWALKGPAGDPLAELVHDRVSVIERRRVAARFEELEIEAVAADDDQLRELGARLRELGATDSEPMPKAVRALGVRATAPPDVVRVSLADRPLGGEIVQFAVADCALRLLAHDPATRLGDAEALHQMRVATRRLRSQLRSLAPLVDHEWGNGLRSELRWLGDGLGTVRDLDVQREQIAAIGADLLRDIGPLLSTIDRRRDDAFAALLADLRGQRYLALLDGLVAGAAGPPLTALASAPAADVVGAGVRRPWRRAGRQVRALDDQSPTSAFHALRVALKRTRYANELLALTLPPRHATRARSFGVRLAELQDLLGQIQDASAGIGLIEALARDQPQGRDSLLAAGRLLEREAARMAAVRTTFEPAWRRARRARQRIPLPA